MFILKSFKSFVLEVFILKGLRERFAKVRILRAKTARRRRVVKRIGERRLTVDSLKSKGKERELNIRALSSENRGGT